MCNILIQYFCTFQNSYHLSPYKITVLLTIFLMLFISSLWLIYFIIENLYFLISLTYCTHPAPLQMYRWPTNTWKMFNITHHQGSANQSTVQYHITPVRMAIGKETTNHKCWIRWRGKAALMHCWWECQLQLLWKTVWRLPKILKIELS